MGSGDGVMVLTGGEVLLRSAASLAAVRAALGQAVRAARRDGVGVPQSVRELLSALEEAQARQASASGWSDVRGEADLSELGQEDLVTTREAAGLMDIAERNVRAQCSRGSLVTARQVGGRWLIDRAEVLERRAS